MKFDDADLEFVGKLAAKAFNYNALHRNKLICRVVPPKEVSNDLMVLNDPNRICSLENSIWWVETPFYQGQVKFLRILLIAHYLEQMRLGSLAAHASQANASITSRIPEDILGVDAIRLIGLLELDDPIQKKKNRKKRNK